MFYEQFIALCERDGIKPTPLIRSLGFSAGNIKRWENGATVNSDILLAIAKHFKVSVDYLLTGEEPTSPTSKTTVIEVPKTQLTENEQEMLSLLNQLSERDQIRLLGRVEGIVKEYGSKYNIGESVG